MTDFNRSVQEAAAVNGPLLQTLSATDYAPPALKEQEKYIVDLEKEIKELHLKITRQLQPVTRQHMWASEKYEKGLMKRFAYKATGQGEKWEGKASEQERKYVEALEEEQNATSLKESLKQKLENSKAAKAELEPVAKQHADAQAQLDSVYQRAFDGPTPSFPEEDQKEEALKKALWNYQDAQAKLDAEKRVVDLLADAAKNVKVAISETESAHSASRADLFGGGMICDMMERSALGKAQQACDQFQSQYKQAQQTSPFVRPLNEIQMADGHMWSDMFFDTLGGDLRMHEKIKDSEAQLGRARSAIDEQAQAAKGRIQDLRGQVDKLSQELTSVRKDLQDARTRAIQQVVNGSSNT